MFVMSIFVTKRWSDFYFPDPYSEKSVKTLTHYCDLVSATHRAC